MCYQVLELGAGIGRFTGELAKSASHLVAVEFMETFIKENEAINGAIFQNIEFKCADVTTIDFPEGSFDFIFSNWLMMYLTDAEVQGEQVVGSIIILLKVLSHKLVKCNYNILQLYY